MYKRQVFTLIFETPSEIAFLIISAGMPVPPWSTSGIDVYKRQVTFLLENGKSETTLTRAKEVQAMAEKMITTAKEDNLHNRRLVLGFVTDVYKRQE